MKAFKDIKRIKKLEEKKRIKNYYLMPKCESCEYFESSEEFYNKSIGWRKMGSYCKQIEKHVFRNSLSCQKFLERKIKNCK